MCLYDRNNCYAPTHTHSIVRTNVYKRSRFVRAQTLLCSRSIIKRYVLTQIHVDRNAMALADRYDF